MADAPPPDELPVAEVAASRRPRLSPVWVVPLVALAVGAWFMWKTWSEQGPLVTIRFPDAEGITANRTTVRFKDMQIGTVTGLRMSPDLTEVIVTAQLTRGWEPHLTSETQFWVVKPRISAGRVTGLGTLISGAYIGMRPGRGGERHRNFDGLTEPPGFPESTPGAHFSLRADDLGSLEVGSPVYFRRLRVGEVDGYRLATDGGHVEVRIFVHAPYHRQVTGATRFWNASGLDISLSAEGLRVDTQSLVSVAVGGIAFGNVGDSRDAPPAEADSQFQLYASRSAASQPDTGTTERFMLYFEESVRGLSVGAPVEFRGIRIGEVLEVRLEFDPESLGFRIPVLIEVERERVSLAEDQPMPGPEISRYLIRRGLRAQLQMGNLLTGQRLISLDMHPDTPETTPDSDGQYLVIPTVPVPLEELRSGLVDLLQRLQGLPLEEITDHLRRSAAGADRLVNSPELAESVRALRSTLSRADALMLRLDQKTLELANDVLSEARRTLTAAETSLAPDSPLQGDIRQALGEITDTARSLRALTDYLGRHPEALLRGKGAPP